MWAVYKLIDDNSNLSKDRINESIVKYELDTLNEFKKATANFSNAALSYHYTLGKTKGNPEDEANVKNRDDYRFFRQQVITTMNPENEYSKDLMNELTVMEQQLLANANGSQVTYVFKDKTYHNYIRTEQKNIEARIY